MIDLVCQFVDGEHSILQTAKRESEDDRFAITSLKPYSVTGEGTVPTSLPVIVIVNSETAGLANLCAYILHSLPNVIVIGITPTSGGGAEVSRVSLTHNWVLQFPSGVKYFINGRSCDLPLRPDVTVNPYATIDEYVFVDGKKERLFINAPLATAINLLENLSSQSLSEETEM